jgi:hypothetical protein
LRFPPHDNKSICSCFYQTTDNRQQTTDNRQQTTDNRQQTTDNVPVSSNQMEGNWRKGANSSEAGNAIPSNNLASNRTNTSWSQVVSSNQTEGSWRKGANSSAQNDDRKASQGQQRNSSAWSQSNKHNNGNDKYANQSRTNAFRYNSGDKNRSSSQNSTNTSTASSSPPTVVEVGKEYDGRVRGIKLGNDRGVYCDIREKGAKIFNMEGFIPKLCLNAKTGCTFKRNERMSVVCVKTHPRVELRPTSEYVRPLLVLDINGPLGDRSPFTPRDEEAQGLGNQRSFNERPHLKDFLALVAQHFEVGIWSCSLRKNLELSLFAGIDLLFVWSQDESTNMYPRTSCVATAKVHSFSIVSSFYMSMS